MTNIEYKDFCDDEEKMNDFFYLSKQDFLDSYSYINEKEWLLTYVKLKFESEE